MKIIYMDNLSTRIGLGVRNTEISASLLITFKKKIEFFFGMFHHGS